MAIEIVVKERRNPRDFDVGYLIRYGDNRYKVTYNKSVPAKGVTKEYTKARGENPDKLECNVRRSRRMVKDYGLCNDWQYFVTLTLDRLKMDRYDLSAYIKKLSQMIRDINKKRDIPIKYLLVPEKHKDHAWHMHGFIMGLTDADVEYGKKRKGRDVYHWIKYQNTFGFCDLEIIDNKDKAVSYMMKYCTKDLSKSVSKCNAKSYYCSKGLIKPVVVKKGRVNDKYSPSYEKKINENGDVVYSEMWLRPDIPEEIATTYLDNTSNGFTKSIFTRDLTEINYNTGEIISLLPDNW